MAQDPRLAALKRRLDNILHAAYQRVRTLGYNATEFFHMLNSMRGVQTAKTLINKPRSTGYSRPWEMGHLELTVEAVVVDNPEFHELFEPEEIQRARARLIENEYTPRH
jgi:hypothetical protein